MQNCKARSAYAFIAVCDSARFERHPHQQAPRSGAVNLCLMKYPNAAPLCGARWVWGHSSFRALSHTAINAQALRAFQSVKVELIVRLLDTKEKLQMIY